MKTGVKVALGIGAVAAAFIAFKFLGEKKLNPFDKMLLDVLNPNSPAGIAERNYLKDRNYPETFENLKSFVDYRETHPNDVWTIAYNRKKSWSKNEIVNAGL